MQAFTPACTIKKVTKKRPVRPIVNFLPIEEENKCLKVILENIGYC